MLVFLTAALTTEVYPYLYPTLMGQAPGHGRALLVLVARNALLIGWYVVAVRRRAKQSTPRRRLQCGAGTLPGPHPSPAAKARSAAWPLTGVGPDVKVGAHLAI
jgi:hypothetical protein